MKYRSTRSDPREVSLSRPCVTASRRTADCTSPPACRARRRRAGQTTLAGVAVPLLAPFFAGDPLER